MGNWNNTSTLSQKKCASEPKKTFNDLYPLSPPVWGKTILLINFFDGKATLVVGTHTHIPTNDTRILKGGTAYQTDAGMCGDYDSVIGMNKDNSINRFLKKKSTKHFPAIGEASLCGVIVECDIETGLAKTVKNFIHGGELKNSQ